MEISIHVSGGSAEEIKGALHDILHGTVVLHRQATVAPETEKPTTEPAQPEVVSPPAKKTRTKKADTTVQADVEDATVVEETKTEPTELTKEQKEAQIEEIKGKLRTLMAKTDENTVWGVLNPLGVKGATNAVETGKGAELIGALDKKLEEVGA